jgi:di/tricarboxylate transporter
MNSEKQNQADVSLDRTLRQWRVDATLPAHFNERVWQKIAREEAHAPATLWARITGWVSQALARPSLAIAYLSMLLLSGLLAGYWHARLDNAQAAEDLSARYVRLIDPYQMPRH